MKKTLPLSFLLYLLFFNFSFSQVLHLVKDINIAEDYTGSYPADFIEYKNKMFFCASTTKYGAELFVSDGTKTGTGLFMDIAKGKYNSSSPTGFIVINDTLYFIVNNRELWKTDGTPEGTVVVKKFEISASTSGTIIKLLNFNNTLYFSAETIEYGFELWKSDGTEQGTTLLKDIAPGNYSGASPREITIIGNEMFFFATDGTSVDQLWKSDGTEQGTVLVKNMEAGSSRVERGTMVRYDNSLYVVVKYNDCIKLWKSDGNDVGTVVVKTLTMNVGAFYGMSNMFVFNDLIYFTVMDNSGVTLWKSDGTLSVTSSLSGIPEDLGASSPVFNSLNNTLLFMANKRLWKLNSAGNGIEILKEFPGPLSSHFNNFTVFQNKIYFKIDDNIKGYEFWQSDGTVEGTRILKDILAGPKSPFYYTNSYNGYNHAPLYAFHDKMYFASKINEYGGFDLWESNGSEEGTKPFAIINQVTAGSYLFESADNNGIVYFSAENNEKGRELWKTDGTEKGTQLLKDINQGPASSFPTSFKKFNNVVIFKIRTDTAEELWKTNGTVSGTVMIKSFYSVDSEFDILNGVIFFKANDGAGNGGLWKSDGTTSGTVFIKPVIFKHPVVYNNVIYFVQDVGYNGSSLWKTDGTALGTVLVKDSLEDVHDMIVSNNRIFLLISNGAGNLSNLWTSDGTTFGTTMLKYGVNSGNNTELINYNNVVYFNGFDAVNGMEVWRSDGTVGGTRLLNDLNPGYGWSNPYNFFVFKGKLYFTTGSLNVNGFYSLVCIGPTENDFTVFKSTSIIDGYNLSFNNDKLYFVANNNKLYITEGNLESMTEVASPFIQNAIILSSLNATGNTLYIAGNTTDTEMNYGHELWKLDNCSNSNSIVKSSGIHYKYNKQNDNTIINTNCYCDALNYLMCTIETDWSTTIINDDVSIKMFIDENLNENYVGRHYEIYQIQNGNTPNFKVKMYFTQEDFDLFNLQHPTVRLPKSANDVEAKRNVIIEKFAGSSISGAIGTYGLSEIIDPNDDEVNWNVNLNRWEVSFNSNGFGGYFMKSAGHEIIGRPENRDATVYPNPVSDKFAINFESDKAAKVVILDMNGRELIEKEVRNNEIIDISILNANVYFVKIITDKGTFIKRVIKN